MKKKNTYKLFVTIGCVLVGLYIIVLCYKYFVDQSWRWGSLAFHHLALIYTIEFLIPGGIMFVIAAILKKKLIKSTRNQHL